MKHLCDSLRWNESVSKLHLLSNQLKEDSVVYLRDLLKNNVSLTFVNFLIGNSFQNSDKRDKIFSILNANEEIRELRILMLKLRITQKTLLSTLPRRLFMYLLTFLNK